MSTAGDHAAAQTTEAMVKTGHADHEHSPAPEQVSEPAARREEDGVSGRVGRNDELHIARGRVEASLNGGQCQIDDVEIQDRQKGAAQENRECMPTSRIDRLLSGVCGRQ
jgi:hypothetical protein